MLRLDLNKLADTDTGSGQEADHKVPGHIFILQQAIFQAEIVRIGNYIFQKYTILYFYAGKSAGTQGEGCGVLVDAIDPRIDGAGLIVVQEPYLELLEIFGSHIGKQAVKKPDRGSVGVNRVFGNTAPLKIFPKNSETLPQGLFISRSRGAAFFCLMHIDASLRPTSLRSDPKSEPAPCWSGAGKCG